MQGKSWKTTAAAVITALATLLNLLKVMVDDDPATSVDMAVLMESLVGVAIAFGFWKARDDDVSSEGTLASKSKSK